MKDEDGKLKKFFGVQLVVSLSVCSLGGPIGGVWMVVSLFAEYGVFAGIAGVMLIPICAFVFPIYFLVTAGIWWPLLFYAAAASTLTAFYLGKFDE